MHNTLLNLTILALLIFLFGSVDRIVYDRRLRFWLLGWLAVCVHLLVHLVVWTTTAPFQYFIHNSLHLLLFTIIGLSFLFSFLPRSSRRQTLSTGMLFATPSALLIFLSLAAPRALWPICLTVLAGEAIAIIEARRLRPPAREGAGILAQVVAVLAGALMLFAAPRLPQIIPYLVLAQIFLVAASGLRNACVDRETRGCFAAIAGLVSWAVILPLRFLVEDRNSFHAAVPALANLWDAPMLLTAFGMILIVLEENMRRAAARSEDYHQLFDCHPLPMYIYNIETLRFLRVNQAALDHYGYSREEFAAMTIEDIRPASELPRLRKVLEGERRERNSTGGWLHTLKSGRIINVDIYRHSLRFEGQLCNAIVALDVTQRNAAEQRNRQVYKIESLGQLTGGIAHDFNNLLTILTTSLELIAQQDLDPPSRSLVQDAIHSVHTGVSLTRRLLTYASQQPLEAEVIRMDHLLDGMATFLKASIGATIALEVSVEPSLWRCTIDPHQLESALLNLALNARDAMPRGGTLTLQARNHHIGHNQSGPLGEISAGDYVLLSLTDTGTGMPEHVLSRATEPFFTTKPIGEGTGLGLSMVYGFLRQSGGSLQVESKAGVGTTIFLYLPRGGLSTDLVVIPEDTAATPIPRGDEIILLVEDEATIRHVLALLLRSLGYTVFDASDGPSAIAHLRTVPGISLLLTDVILPARMDGATLAATARSLQPEINVLFSSGYTRDVLLREGRIPEDAQLLTKPYHLTELAQQVRQTLDQPTLAQV